MLWASPESSTPSPSLYVQLRSTGTCVCVVFFLVLYLLTLSSAMQGKLVVGHNMLLDVMHTIHQFYCPLPEVHTEQD